MATEYGQFCENKRSVLGRGRIPTRSNLTGKKCSRIPLLPKQSPTKLHSRQISRNPRLRAAAWDLSFHFLGRRDGRKSDSRVKNVSIPKNGQSFFRGSQNRPNSHLERRGDSRGAYPEKGFGRARSTELTICWENPSSRQGGSSSPGNHRPSRRS